MSSTDAGRPVEAARPPTPPPSALPEPRTFFASPPTPDRHLNLSAVQPASPVIDRSSISSAAFTLPPVPPTPSRPHTATSTARRLIVIHDTDSESDRETPVLSTPSRRAIDVRADDGSDDDVVVVSTRSSSETGILHWDPAALRPTPKGKAKSVPRKPSRSILQPIAAFEQPSAPVASTSMLPPAPTATPRRRKKAPAPDSFAARRDKLSAELVEELDRTVFGGQLPDGLTVAWNARLTTTAGYAQLKAGAYSIQLSEKVVDGPERLRHTLAHELCQCVDRRSSQSDGAASLAGSSSAR